MTFQALGHSFVSKAPFEYGLHTPEALIGETNTTPVSAWNDVKVIGTNVEKNTKIEVVGFFMVPNNEPKHEVTETAIRKLANQTGLPVITLPPRPAPVPMR
jgi:hypothetical protein